jgi:hypothetical protein
MWQHKHRHLRFLTIYIIPCGTINLINIFLNIQLHVTMWHLRLGALG